MKKTNMPPPLSASSIARRASTIASYYEAIERVIIVMRERVAEPLSLQDLADIAILSPFHFDRVFRKITGIPPCQFLAALRIESAKRLLLTTELSVTDVCFEVGYNSLGTFITRFTQLVGVSPRRLRRMAEDTGNFYLELLREPTRDLFPIVLEKPGLTGQIISEDDSAQPIFVGLFLTAIPQSRPVGCAILSDSGTYCINPIVDGCYYVFAASFDWSEDPLTYLLPDENNLRVGVSQYPLQFRRDLDNNHADVILRPLRSTDPPLLVSLPLLFAEHFAAEKKVAI